MMMAMVKALVENLSLILQRDWEYLVRFCFCVATSSVFQDGEVCIESPV